MSWGLGAGAYVGGGEGGSVSGTDEARGRQLYTIALSLVETEGRFVTVGVMTFEEYRSGKLSVVLMPGSGNLDNW